MILQQKKFCFCTLALGNKYRCLAKELAADLEIYSPGTSLLVYTDLPQDFCNNPNILAFKHRQKGIKCCYNDKRFVIAEALSRYNSAIWVDADTKIVATIPDDIEWLPGITSGNFQRIFEHSRNKRVPTITALIKQLGAKLNISLDNTCFVHEALFVVTRDGDKEKEFIKQWGIAARFFELKGMHDGEGNSIGLAANKVGWTVRSNNWEYLKKAVKHTYASREGDTKTFWDKLKDPKAVKNKLQSQLSYHYRLNLARLLALANFGFYYR